jgi:phosphoribosylglycinamide formyltransferase-1
MIKIAEPGKLALAVMASGRGSNFDAICQAIDRKDLNAEVKVVLSDMEAPVLDKARQRGIPALHINPTNYANKADYEKVLVEKVKEYGADLIVLAGYMRLIGSELLHSFPMRVVNIHPALLPSFKGLHAQRQAVEYGVRYSGCTIHLVDEGMDTGPIIMQKVVPVYPEDDEESLTQRILAEEHDTYWRALQLIAEGKLYLKGRKVLIKEENT